MTYRMTTHLAGMAVALCLAIPMQAGAADGAMSQAEYKTGRAKIEARHDAARKACRPLKGQRAEICLLQAKGRAEVARAELQARREPGPDSEQAVKEAQAASAHAVAKAECRQANAKARKSCVTRADAVRDAAIRQAKVEKVQARRAQEREAAADPRPEPTQKEKYAAERARCAISGAERDRCLAEAKRRFDS